MEQTDFTEVGPGHELTDEELSMREVGLTTSPAIEIMSDPSYTRDFAIPLDDS